jgi:hypothetical protein
MLGLDVPNDRLDQGTATHPAADRGDDAADLTLIRRWNLGISADVNAVQFGNYGRRVWRSKGLSCGALACSRN